MTDPTTTDRTAPGAVPGEKCPIKSSEALRAARVLITPEEAWTKNAFAKNAKGEWYGVGWRDDAVCWCAYGALEKVTHQHFGGRLGRYFDHVIDDHLSVFNDTHTHAEVLDAFDRAIALAEAEENARATEQGAGDAGRDGEGGCG